MSGYKTIRCNTDVFRILCPDELGFKSVTIVGPMRQVKDGDI